MVHDAHLLCAQFVHKHLMCPSSPCCEAQLSHKFAPLPVSATPGFAYRITSWRRVSVDDDRVDAVISHLEGVNTTLKSLRSQGGDLEPFQGSDEVRVISCFQTANKAWTRS